MKDHLATIREAVRTDNAIHGKEVHTLDRPEDKHFTDAGRKKVEADVQKVLGEMKGEVHKSYWTKYLGMTTFWRNGEDVVVVTGKGDNVEVERSSAGGGKRTRKVNPEAPEAQRLADIRWVLKVGSKHSEFAESGEGQLVKALAEVLKLAYQSVGLPVPYFSQDELYLALQETGVPQNGLALTEGSANDITKGKPPKEGVGEGSKKDGKVDSKGLPTPTEMMKAVEEQGSKSLESATRSALNRLIAKHGVEGILRQRRLFDDMEREAVINALNETLTTSDLLGRARIRTHDKGHATFADLDHAGWTKNKSGEWEEVLHPRDEDGKFSKGGGSKGGSGADSKKKKDGAKNNTTKPGANKELVEILDHAGWIKTDAGWKEVLDHAGYEEREKAEEVWNEVAPSDAEIKGMGPEDWAKIVDDARKKDDEVRSKKGEDKKPKSFWDLVAAWARKGWKQKKSKTKHSESWVEKFADAPKHPLPPTKALQYFAKKIPQLKRLLANGEYAETNHDKAFELALNTDEVVLGKIKDAIRKALEEKRVFSGQDAVNRILEESGVGTTVKGKPVDNSYSSMVFRTNMANAMTTGAYQELQEVADAFPVWQYVNPVDHRSRPSHAAKNGKYYPTSRPFEEVRGKAEKDAIQCRCDFVPVSRGQWAKLQKQGKILERD